jgi:apolipoprotein D and lipocalin family protein
MKRLALVLLLGLSAACAPSTTERLGLDELETIEGFELERYLGRWYEIGSYPQTFQEGCVGTTATYSLKDDGNVDVLNECLQNGEPIEANGTARPVDLDRGKLEVSFFPPFWSEYWILDLREDDGPDADYTQAVVGEPGRDALWILSRTPELDPSTEDALLADIEAQDYGLDRLRFTEQPDAAD